MPSDDTGLQPGLVLLGYALLMLAVGLLFFL